MCVSTWPFPLVYSLFFFLSLSLSLSFGFACFFPRQWTTAKEKVEKVEEVKEGVRCCSVVSKDKSI